MPLMKSTKLLISDTRASHYLKRELLFGGSAMSVKTRGSAALDKAQRRLALLKSIVRIWI
jgi:hypothetical protein